MVKFSAALAAVVVFGASAFAQTKAGPGKGTVDQFKDAYAVATANPPSGQLVNSRVENKSDGSVVMGFYMYNREQRLLFEREVDLKSGKVVKDTSKGIEKVNKDMLDLLMKKATGKAKLPEGRLMEIASKLLKDKEFSEMKYEKVGDDLVLTFGDLQINAETGKEIKK
jgi:hypothetical protein